MRERWETLDWMIVELMRHCKNEQCFYSTCAHLYERPIVRAHPGIPPASMLLAKVTSLDHTSNCHFRNPKTPQCTLPEWIPTLIFSTSTPVTSRTRLRVEKHDYWGQSNTIWDFKQSSLIFHSRNSFYHIKAHLHTTMSMILPWFWKATDTVVAVT